MKCAKSVTPGLECEETMRYVRTDDLEPDMILATPLLDSANRVMLATGKRLTEYMIGRLVLNGVEGIYIDDEISRGIDIAPPISPKLQKQVLDQLRKQNVDEIVNSAKDIVDEVADNADCLNSLILIKDYDGYTYQHSVNVGILSSVVGFASGMARDEVVNLTATALLHDIGKTAASLEILNKKEKLTDEEMEHLREHPVTGYQMLQKCDTVQSVIRVGVYEHHENMDGTGYPRGIAGDKIHTFARIIHVTDVYDAMISKRPYKDEIHPEDAMSFILGKSGTMFDPFIVDIFLRCVPAYPKGITIQLSNGEKAIVIHNYPEYPLRPCIRMFDGREVSLMNDIEYRSVVIVDVLI